jgi:hypothetical protein
MKTVEVEIAIMNFFDFVRNLIVPNVTPLSRLVQFETDLLIMSNSNYCTAIEIKVSKSDLINDLKKPHISKFNDGVKRKYYFSKIKKFYYAIPVELKEVALKQIPPEVGLITVEEYLDYKKRKKYKVNIIKESEILFNYKWTDEEKYKLARLGTLRIFSLKEKLIKSKTLIEE